MRAAYPALAALLVLAVGAVGAEAPLDDDRVADLFVQVSFPNLPASADPEEDPGRVEVEVAGRFVGCAWASSYRPSPGEVRLTPIHMGFSVRGRRSEVRVRSYGELGRLGGQFVTVKIPSG